MTFSARNLRYLAAATFMLVSGSLLASPIPSAPSVDANSYVLMDFHSGGLLADMEPDKSVEPASITKVMTGYVVFSALESGSISLDDQVIVSERAWRMPGSRMFVEVGREVTVEDLLQGMIIQSGNDASVALAEHVAGSEAAFVDMMNQYTQQLGMENTSYANSTGLPDENQYTTAYDTALLARALIKDFPDYYDWYSEREFTYNGIRQNNRNTLLWRDDSVDGIKTGHTRSAGYCLVTSAQRDDARLVSVVMGSSSERSRADASQTLLNYGFRFFETHRLYAAGESLAEERVWGGAADSVPLGLEEALYVTVPRGRYNDLEPIMNISGRLDAPIREGDELGTVRVSLDGETVAERPVFAKNDVASGSLWRRLVDRVKLFFE
ncbi:D-alanyl-D-alanine carboxypeptidase (penicillin-binding protein 5/6) [Natronospira proteinivora]|uniref:serine-type D-Ala-D-Ala carboxypeptidase n=1 Tax=Natronospira proteinivora TaxID=1807133 RepID=A0ABT1G7V1_9GAMM|nr:D-alanyl-D-alanine carboxypeptidase family protein [Natronospira proteinivora]MCP1727382.1 D-alanyl-D-alanine carboxypeptidase (penicillin-binding protein 5/6) [Natronospira proteinivora]